MDPGVRRTLRELPRARFLSIQNRRLRRGALRRADGLLRNGREQSDGSAIPLDAPYPWERASTAEHGLADIDPLLDAHSWSGNAAYLVAASAVAADWIDRGRRAPEAAEPIAAGQRAYRMGYLIRAAAAADQIDDALFGEMIQAALADTEMLAGVEEPAPIPVACGLVSLSGYLGDAVGELRDLRRPARERAGTAFGREFGRDGMHVSRSPARHAAATETIGAVLDAGLIDDLGLAGVRSSAEDALAWLTMPDGRLAPFGNTGEVLVSPAWGTRGTTPNLLRDHARNPVLLYTMTAGALGHPDGACWRELPEAGFAFARSHWPESVRDRLQSGYLAVTTARRPDIGRQADALSFVWFDAGRLLLGDSGQVVDDDPSGVEETADTGTEAGGGDRVAVDPSIPSPAEGRDYVRSTRAHNTVEIDGIDQEPRKSGPLATATRNGRIGEVYFVDCSVEFETAKHRRSLAWWPGRWLLVADRLAAESGEHRFRQWFHASDPLDVVALGGRFVLGTEGDPVAWVSSVGGGADAMTPVRGRAEAVVQGWWSPGTATLIPAWAFGWEQTGSEAFMACVFSLTGPVGPTSAEGARLEWTVAGEQVVASFTEFGIGSIEIGGEEAA